MNFDNELMKRSGELRKKVAECNRLAKMVRIQVVYEELRLRGDGYNECVRILCERFGFSPSTIRRVIKKFTRPKVGDLSKERVLH